MKENAANYQLRITSCELRLHDIVLVREPSGRRVWLAGRQYELTHRCAARLGIESSLRPRGRPPKKAESRDK